MQSQQSAVTRILISFVILRKSLSCMYTHTRARARAHTHTHTHTHTVASFFLSNCSGYLSEETLQRFQFIKVIRGQLQISGWNLIMFPSLPSVIDYFRNVEYIGSLNLTLDTVNTEGDALVISTNPGLQRVDLSRLRLVRYGNVRVRNNPALCYVGDFQTTTGNDSVYINETQLILPTGPNNFMSVEDCSKCHPAASPPTLCACQHVLCMVHSFAKSGQRTLHSLHKGGGEKCHVVLGSVLQCALAGDTAATIHAVPC